MYYVYCSVYGTVYITCYYMSSANRMLRLLRRGLIETKENIGWYYTSGMCLCLNTPYSFDQLIWKKNWCAVEMYMDTREGLLNLELLSYKESLNKVRVHSFFRVINSDAMRWLNKEQVITVLYNLKIRCDTMIYQKASSIL